MFKHLVASVAVCSKAVVLLLLNHSVCGICLARKRERSSIVFLLSFGCCSVFLPRGTMSCSVVCDCGISLSYSLTFK